MKTLLIKGFLLSGQPNAGRWKSLFCYHGNKSIAWFGKGYFDLQFVTVVDCFNIPTHTLNQQLGDGQSQTG